MIRGLSLSELEKKKNEIETLRSLERDGSYNEGFLSGELFLISDLIKTVKEITISEEKTPLETAMKIEVLFQAEENNIELTEQEAEGIADTLVYELDWSSINDLILQEIEAFKKE